MSNNVYKNKEFVHPKKWRETCDPFALDYREFTPTEILGYPHAGNDVFHAKGVYKGSDVRVYIKAARRKSDTIRNEVEMLDKLRLDCAPEVIDYSLGEQPFVVTLEMPGRRLSAIVGENEDMASLDYMEKFGEMLGRIHNITDISADCVKDRSFFHTPTDEQLDLLGLSHLRGYFDDAPQNTETVFCHGDMHYANVLWENGEISAVLDFELCGYGNRNFDIAWSTALRPGQRFMRTEKEVELFLKGYAKHGQYDACAVKYYTAQIYVHFLGFNGDDADYCGYVRQWLEKNCV